VGSPTPEFIAAFTDLLCKYPENVVRDVLNPTSGLPVQSEFLPALAKIKDALDRASEAQGKVLARDARVRAQLEERRLLEAPKANRPTYEELIATLPASLRMDRRELKPLSEAEFLAKFPNITKEQLDAIPNAKTGTFAKLLTSVEEEPNPFEAPQ
jgi:hypothetical protein